MKSKTPCLTSTVTDALMRLPGPEGQRFASVFQHGTLLVEIYAPRGTDPQQPHTRDEIYFIATGSGNFVCGDTKQSFGPTDSLFAAAGVEHRFENFSDDLTVWVLFYAPGVGKKMDNMPEYRSIVPVFSVADVGATMNWYQS